MPVSTDSAHGHARLPPMPSDPLWARRWKGDRHNQEGTSIVCLQLAYLLQGNSAPKEKGRQTGGYVHRNAGAVWACGGITEVIKAGSLGN